MAPETRNAARQRSGNEDNSSTSTEGGQQFELNMEASQHIAGNVRERIQQLEAVLNEGNEGGITPRRSMLRREDQCKDPEKKNEPF